MKLGLVYWYNNLINFLFFSSWETRRLSVKGLGGFGTLKIVGTAKGAGDVLSIMFKNCESSKWHSHKTYDL